MFYRQGYDSDKIYFVFILVVLFYNTFLKLHLLSTSSSVKEKTFKYLGSLLTNQNSIQEEIKCRLKAGNACYYSAN